MTALKMDMVLATTGTMGEAGNTPVMTYLGTKSKQSHEFLLLVREEEEEKT